VQCVYWVLIVVLKDMYTCRCVAIGLVSLRTSQCIHEDGRQMFEHLQCFI
jgi:hypothetical protein